jgi:HD superfamily phosphohydrolase
MEIRDPIHGFIEYNHTEEKIINSSVFQRLRNIKQLALASYVYPGAHHTRFEHSIGTMHLAGRIADKLGIRGKRRKTLRLAALLHDIGHGPFSHVSEQVLEHRTNTKLIKKYEADNAHELMSILIILKHPDIQVILDESQRNEVASLLKKQEKRSLDKDIISGPLDVDKLDYLLRDSYFARVRYGTFDLDKVINSFVLVELGETTGEALGINDEGVHAIEQLLLAKYHMNAQVYRHRVRRITDAMLVRGISFSLDEGLLKGLCPIQDSEEFVKGYTRYNDLLLVDEILSNGKGVCREYFEKIKNRQILKEVFETRIDQVDFPDPIILENLKNVSERQMKEIEQAAASIFSSGTNKIRPNSVITDKQSLSNPTFKSPEAKIDSDTIMVLGKKGKRSLFTEKSSIFQNPSVDPSTEMLHIYLPLDWLTDRSLRNKYIKERQKMIRKKLEEIVK